MSSVCRCSLSEKALCTSELIADYFCAGWWCDSTCRYLSTYVVFTLDGQIPSAFLETKTSRKESFPFSSMSIVDIWMSIVEKNKEFRLSISRMCRLHNGIKFLILFECFSKVLFLKMLHEDVDYKRNRRVHCRC